ncbi:amidohydrolase [Paramaledivibacter caminithermalis]|uniref:Peptidase M20 domain-containing protein 2 n=1 Tax=Paramaledivibacter caminithermalis (strain DSM 15212 / CIP 107654 / DViRD3) TaxID=1121301 RepID=A0A1M6P036_PARC5|nr:amidohydrolase [Paramaledivibacter caminithermalis]SHK01286.1 amidohydrolase [Paramaledivibacter caminithermalis DSM 15212]
MSSILNLRGVNPMILKQQICDEIENIEKELVDLSKKIHEKPELAFHEYSAAKNILLLLEKHGFNIKKGIANLETAFRAEYNGKGKGPTIAFLAEYDALPEIGHGCGHNLIGTMSVGAAIGLSKIADKIDGKIVVLGTPGEEGGGGKVIMVNEGVFDDIDYAMMIHPSTSNIICRGGLATRKLTIEYHGKSAHSSSPEDGINALQAVINTFNFIDHIRAILPLKSNINGIITNGGNAPNVIPDYASCSFSVRADTVSDLKIVVEHIEHIVKTIEKLMGVKADISKTLIYTERYPNKIIAEKLKENIAQFGEVMNYPKPNMKYGSSDIGNVSLIVPSIHSYLKIAEPGTISHSIDFTKAAITDDAHIQMIKGAKALALTGFDIFSDEKLRQDIYEEFHRTVPKYNKSDLE